MQQNVMGEKRKSGFAMNLNVKGPLGVDIDVDTDVENTKDVLIQLEEEPPREANHGKRLSDEEHHEVSSPVEKKPSKSPTFSRPCGRTSRTLM